jgi:hypothetical protein
MLGAGLAALLLAAGAAFSAAYPQWIRRDERWPPRGPWNRALARELPDLYREFNGIDYGHARLAETLIRTQDPEVVERARLDVLEFIRSSPRVAPDEDQIAPAFARMAWEAQRAFDGAHAFHRSLYDLFASDGSGEKERIYRFLLEDYLAGPDAITPHPLDHAGKLWSFPESKTFRDRFPGFNGQIWAYHWLQAAVYDVQLLGGAGRQRELMPGIIARYHRLLEEPPAWEFMPLMGEVAPGFSAKYPEAAAIFDNLHMLHDNLDDILSRPDLYQTPRARREAILRVLPIYLHRNHAPEDRYADHHAPGVHGGHGAHAHAGAFGGPRPPAALGVLGIEPRGAGHEGH